MVARFFNSLIGDPSGGSVIMGTETEAFESILLGGVPEAGLASDLSGQVWTLGNPGYRCMS
jgi:hypothetical protein